MPAISTESTLGQLVVDHPDLARELERRDLDYCCQGERTLGEACAEVGLEPGEVAAELAEVATAVPEAWTVLGVAELVDHLEATHHAYLHAELPRLTALMLKVDGVHGERHPELAELRTTLAELVADLEPHLAKEERVLFPMVRELATAETAPSFHCGSLQNPISVMLMEHDRAGELLERIRTLTDGFRPPDDACASYQALFAGLEELDADTRRHVHKENHRLFPAVVEMEAALVSS